MLMQLCTSIAGPDKSSCLQTAWRSAQVLLFCSCAFEVSSCFFFFAISFVFMADEWAWELCVCWSYYWELCQDLSALPFLFPSSLDAEIALRWLLDFLPLDAPRVKAWADLSIRTRRGETGEQAQCPFGGIRACLEPALHRPWFTRSLSRQSWNAGLKMKKDWF